jgi:hypothetical protein
MKDKFKRWMEEKDQKKPNTAYSYANSIDKISDHYSEKTGRHINIYHEKDFSLLKKISSDYATDGKFSQFGYEGKGTVRNAIATYIRFLQSVNSGNELMIDQDTVIENDNNELLVNDEDLKTNNYNFTYERDLKNALINQSMQLFPGYRIFGENKEGIEYAIEGKRIDLLLENPSDNCLLAIELKSGEADFRVFGQISMYLGLLSKRFPDRISKGIIIAGEIHDTLLNACLITDKIELKIYQMQLTLENP